MKRNKEPEKVPVTGLPRRMLVTYAFRQGNLDAPTYSHIQREAREAREQHREAQQKRDVVNARRRRNAAMQFRRARSKTLIPLRSVAGICGTSGGCRLIGAGRRRATPVTHFGYSSHSRDKFARSSGRGSVVRCARDRVALKLQICKSIG